jgi:type I site-specific restriction-modification system R (restriction) subunit
VVHFAVDDHEVRLCTHLKGKGMAKDSWFLPFNQGWNDGAGNPPNPDGLKTDYLWKRILTPARLTEILENYAQVVEEKDEKTGKKKQVQIFPRYHQLDVVRKLLADAQEQGAGKRYLIQHSAGSGKSNSIAWLAHQLIGLRKDGATVFDSIIVVTDRRILDQQIRDTIKQLCPGRQHHRRGEGRREHSGPSSSAQVHQGRQEDHHLHGAEVSLHARRASAASIAAGGSPSSSTRRTPARAGAPPRR